MRARTVARCQACGAEMPRWVGRCPECGAWGTVVEEPVARPPARQAPAVRTVPLRALDEGPARRLPAGLEEVDRVLGGGLVRGSVVLLAGEPGVGKSTLSLQVASALAGAADVVLVCGEESPGQVRARAVRLGPIPERLVTLADPCVEAILAAVREGPAAVVVDSIQTVFDPEVASAPGSVAQVRECGARLARAAREHGVAVLLVGHVTKDGSVAGPRVLEHLVDAVLTFEGDRQRGMRVLRALKNRFGSTQEVGFFEMTAGGLVAIRDASSYLLADRTPGLAGSVLAACVDGQRPFVIEVQALVSSTESAVPRRMAQGVDGTRLPLLVAVLEQRLHLAALARRDIYVSAVGGLRVAEPAADLPVALAILSAFTDVPLPDGTVAFGEVGLAGEVRRAPAPERRLAEARSVGCTRAVVPAALRGGGGGLELVPVAHLRDALALFARARATAR